MSRIGNDFISRRYKNAKFEKIERKSNLHDIQFGGRLSKGETYLIGEGDKEKFFLTQYKDGSVELWMREMMPNGYVEKTIVCLAEYEVDCIYKMLDNIFAVLLTKEDENEIAASMSKAKVEVTTTSA